MAQPIDRLRPSRWRLFANGPPDREVPILAFATWLGRRPARLAWSVVSPLAAIRSLSVALHSAGPSGAVRAWPGSVLRVKVHGSGVKVPGGPVCVPGFRNRDGRLNASPARSGCWDGFKGTPATLQVQVKRAASGGPPRRLRCDERRLSRARLTAGSGAQLRRQAQ